MGFSETKIFASYDCSNKKMGAVFLMTDTRQARDAVQLTISILSVINTSGIKPNYGYF